MTRDNQPFHAGLLLAGAAAVALPGGYSAIVPSTKLQEPCRLARSTERIVGRQFNQDGSLLSREMASSVSPVRPEESSQPRSANAP